jgi:ribosomal protein S18 acetylase RimI-like enzyme
MRLILAYQQVFKLNKKKTSYCYDSQFSFLKRDKELFTQFNECILKESTQQKLLNTQLYTKDEPWDTAHFKYKIGRLLWLEETNDYTSVLKLLGNSYQCCYYRVNSQHHFCEFAQEKKIYPKSIKHIQFVDLKNHSFKKSEKIFLYAPTPSNVLLSQSIMKITSSVFQHGRFRTDKNFKESDVDKLYSQWIENELVSNTSELFYTLENEKMTAFCLYKSNISPLSDVKIGFVALIAASREASQKGYASVLLQNLLALKKEDTSYVIANTDHNNTSALQFFKKNQFTISKTLHEYHLWK